MRFFSLTYNSLKQFLFQQKLILHRQNNFYRVKSGYFRSDEDVKNQAKEKLTVRFPEIPIEKEIKVEKVYTEYRYGQISTLREGEQFWLLHIYSKYDLIFQLLYFSIKNAQNLADNFSFLVHVLKSLYPYSLLFSKIFLTQVFPYTVLSLNIFSLDCRYSIQWKNTLTSTFIRKYKLYILILNSFSVNLSAYLTCYNLF